MTLKDKPGRTVVTPRNPMLEVLQEPIIAGTDGRLAQSFADYSLYRDIGKALEGDRKAILANLKLCAAREIELIGKGRYRQPVDDKRPNLNYEFVGDVAALLGITEPFEPAPGTERSRFERAPRSRLLLWVIHYACKLGYCSNAHLAGIREWEAHNCPQWRYTTFFDMAEMPDEFVSLALEIEARGREAARANKPKRSIHPYDKKVRYRHNGEVKRMPVLEALTRCARNYAMMHPNDRVMANTLRKIEQQMSEVYEKERRWSDDDGLSIFDDELYEPKAPLAVACLEDALIGMGAAVILYPYRKCARAVLLPWIVQAALDRMVESRLTRLEQMWIFTRTLHPEQVDWPDWWEIEWCKKPASV